MEIPPPARDRNAPYHILLHDPRKPPASFADGSEGSGGGGAGGMGASAWQRMHMVSALPHVMVTLPVRHFFIGSFPVFISGYGLFCRMLHVLVTLLVRDSGRGALAVCPLSQCCWQLANAQVTPAARKRRCGGIAVTTSMK